MRTITTLDDFDTETGCVLCIGVFDGFHLGHKHIVDAALHSSKELGTPVCALTFEPHPRTVLQGIKLDLITSVEHRLALLERAGVTTTALIAFTPEFAKLTADEFIVDIAQGKLGAKSIVMGRSARIGAGNSGDATSVAKTAAQSKISTQVVEPVIVDGERVSSTRVREAIQAGDLDLARKFLGRRVSVLGTVVHGRGIGRQLGFPTANLDVHREVRPPYGVYATWAICDGARVPSVTNVGFRPTFDPAKGPAESGVRPDRLVEAHLLADVESEIYDKQMEIEFVEKLRDERRFGTNDELAKQITADIESAREALAGAGDE